MPALFPRERQYRSLLPCRLRRRPRRQLLSPALFSHFPQRNTPCTPQRPRSAKQLTIPHIRSVVHPPGAAHTAPRRNLLTRLRLRSRPHRCARRARRSRRWCACRRGTVAIEGSGVGILHRIDYGHDAAERVAREGRKAG